MLACIILVSLWYACNRTDSSYEDLSSQDEPLILESDSTQSFHILEEAPSLKEGILEFDMIPLNSHGHMGAVISYQSADSWIYLGCDVNADLFGRANWYLTTPHGTSAFAKDINKPYEGITRRIRIKYLQDVVTLWVDGEEVICKLANDLGLDPDVMLAMAGKVSSELQEVIRNRPELFGALLRELKSAPDNVVLRLVREVRDGEW